MSSGGIVRKIMTVTVKAVDEDRAVITMMGTTPAEDRYGDVVVPEGANMDAYRANPVFLFAHRYDLLPVGKSLAERITKHGVEFDIQFDLADPMGAQIYRKYREGYLNATSIGFIPKEMEPKPNGGYTYKEWELLELSAVPVPANPEALQMALSKSMDAADFARTLADDLGLERAPVETEPSSTPDPVETEPLIQKAGAVLNKSNKAKLQQARALIMEVLDSAGEEEPVEETAPPPTDPTQPDTPVGNEPAGVFVPAVTEALNTTSRTIEPNVFARALAIALQNEVERLVGKPANHVK